MKGFLTGLALLVSAVMLQVLASHRVPPLHRSVDLVLLVVVYYGSAGQRVGAMFAGAAGGLLEDVWLGDVMGIHGLSKTLIAYVLGGIGSHFELSSAPARTVAVMLAALLESAVQPLILLGLGLPAAPPQPVDLLLRCLGNGVAGALLFSLAAKKGLVPAT